LALKSWKLKFKVLENILENYTLRHFCSEFRRLKLHQISNPAGGSYSTDQTL